MKRFVAVLFALLLVGGVLGWWILRGTEKVAVRPIQHSPDPPKPSPLVATKPARPNSEFTGSQSCRECHAGVCNEYAGHPMARSLDEVTKHSDLEDYSEKHTFNSTPRRQYRVERNESGVFHHEIGLDGGGNVIFDQSVPVQFAMGSGKRGRSYIINRDGWLYVSPISWYTQASRWDLSPGYSGESHPRFSRQVLERCLQCHVGQLAYQDNAHTVAQYQRYANPPFREYGISCERCHGPGREHITIRRADRNSVVDPIINPADLPPPRRDAVCNQCHLQGEYQVLRYGRSHNDFRPGDNIGDIWTVFVQDTDLANSTAEAPAVSHMEQMFASQCFRGSRAAMGCISCHPSHSTPNESTKHEFFRERCLECHQQHGCSLSDDERNVSTPPGSCIACHMPRFDASDIPHTAQTEHRILRKPLSANSSQSSDKEISLRIFDSAVCKLPKSENARAQGLILALRAESYKNPGLANQAEEILRPLKQVFPEDSQLLDALAVCCAVQGRANEAAEFWELILAHDPHNLQTLFSLLVSHQDSGRAEMAIKTAERYLALNDWSDEVHLRLSQMLAEKNNLLIALEHAQRAVEINLAAISSYIWLAEVYRRMDRIDESKRVLETVRRLSE